MCQLNVYITEYVMYCCCVCVFCVQAEDGIRDLVRSRGLGDVYKRQVQHDVGQHQRGVGVEQVQRAHGLEDRHQQRDQRKLSLIHI